MLSSCLGSLKGGLKKVEIYEPCISSNDVHYYKKAIKQISSKASQDTKQDENDTMSGQNVRFCITCSDK